MHIHITDFIYFLKSEIRAIIFLISQNKSYVPKPILELHNDLIIFGHESEEQQKQSVPEIVDNFLLKLVDRIAHCIATLYNLS